jgi:hypothetical protein
MQARDGPVLILGSKQRSRWSRWKWRWRWQYVSKQLPYFDLEHMCKVLYNDAIQNAERLHMLQERSVAAILPVSILNVVRLYISSSRYLLDPYARSEEDGVLVQPKRRLDENSKLQQQEFLGMSSARLDEGLEKALRVAFPYLFQGLSRMGMRGLDGSIGSSAPSGSSAPNRTTTPTSTTSAQGMTALSSSSISTPCASSSWATFASSALFAWTSAPPAAYTQSSSPSHATAFSTTTTTTSAATFDTTPSHKQIQDVRDLTPDKRHLFLAHCPQKLLNLA